ncbi:hypothetical protein BDR22DRAFT_963331 [Usnea florida]
MFLKPALFLSLTTLIPHVSAVRNLDGITIFQRQASPTAAASTTLPTTTSTGDEFSDPFSFTLDGKIFPPDIVADNVIIPKDFSVNCVNCSINGNISISAGGDWSVDHIQTPSDVEEIPSDFDFSDKWVAATFDNLDATFEFGINLTASNATNEFIVPLDSKTISKTFDILTLTATIGAEIHGWVNTSDNVNFTHGFNFHVPPGSEIIIDLDHLNQSLSVGFNHSALTPLPFTATTGDLDIGIELSFRPSVTFLASVDEIGTGGSIGLTVTLDVPKLDVEVQQIHNVTSNCAPAQASTPSNQVYQNLTQVVPSIGFDAFEIFTEKASVLGASVGSDNQDFQQNTTENLSTTCYFFDQANETLGSVPSKKPANISVAKRTRIPLTEYYMAVAMVALLMM